LPGLLRLTSLCEFALQDKDESRNQESKSSQGAKHTAWLKAVDARRRADEKRVRLAQKEQAKEQATKDKRKLSSDDSSDDDADEVRH